MAVLDIEIPASSAVDRSLPAMTPTQLRTFDDLLAVGVDRPVAPNGLADELRVLLASGTGDALSLWTEKNLWVSKSLITTALTCEGMVKANAEAPRSGSRVHPATIVGIVTHRAIQLSFTHPGMSVTEAVESSLRSSRSTEEKVGEFWDAADPAMQSDLMMQMVSRVTSFLDSWPPLSHRWHPRFEESLVAKVGNLTLSARPDLVLGRPRADGTQTMLLADFKTGALRDDHDVEAQFYALVATLRHGVPPFRSVVYSLASGEWTEPDVTAASLREIAGHVIAAVRSHVEVLTDTKVPALTPGRYCMWCPAAASCPDAQRD